MIPPLCADDALPGERLLVEKLWDAPNTPTVRSVIDDGNEGPTICISDGRVRNRVLPSGQ
jgi:hypothetical protein